MNSNAQAWGFDIIVGTVIFFAAVVIFYFYSINSPTEGDDVVNELYYEGTLISEIILSEGYPIDWTDATVVSPGILSNGAINDTKLERLYTLTQTSYNTTKQLLTTTNNFYFLLSDPMVINGASVEGIGREPANTTNLLVITRYTIYQNKPTTFRLYLWQ